MLYRQDYLKEACDDMDVGASCSHKHTNCQAGVHILQVHLGGMRSAKKITMSRAGQWKQLSNSE